MKVIYTIFALLLTFTIAQAQSQNITKEQAIADIDSLMYTLSEVHPNLFGNIGMSTLLNSVAKVKDELPDSISSIALYRNLAPVIAQIGDAHTSIEFPYREVMAQTDLFLPLLPGINNSTGKMYVKASADNIIPFDSEIVSINGLSSNEMVSKMTELISGEREFFKLTMADNYIIGLFHLLFPSEEYEIIYREENEKNEKKVVLKGMDSDSLNARLVISPKLQKLMNEHENSAPYSFRTMEDTPIAVMSFNSCVDTKGMAAFADSMFNSLKERNIKQLIIDVRINGGGNSRVGDALLKHIAPKPFSQYGQTYVRITPTTKRLGVGDNVVPGVYFYPQDSTNFKEPLPADQRFAGKVYLLTSHTTFSSASSFAWAFKEFGCGVVIGEETGGMSVHYGDMVNYIMPNSKLSCSISHKRFWQYGADEGSIHGVIPDVEVTQDEALDAAIKLIKKDL